MKILIAIAALGLAAPTHAETLNIVGEAQGPVTNADSLDIDRLDGRVDALGSAGRAFSRQNRNGIAGAAAMSAIDFIKDQPAIGVGVSTWDGATGWAVKGMLPLGQNIHGSVSAFGAGNDVGAAGSIVIGF